MWSFDRGRFHIRNTNPSLRPYSVKGIVWLRRIERSGEEPSRQRATYGDFPEPTQSWAHFGVMTIAPTSSTDDLLVLGTLNQEVAQAMHEISDSPSLSLVVLSVYIEEGPAL